MVSAQGGKIINLTNSAYTSGSPRWVLDGNAILFMTERYGTVSYTHLLCGSGKNKAG